MTNQEAIKGLNNLFSEHELTLPCTDSLEILHMSVNALEKQTPQKPVLCMNEKSGMFVDYADGHGEYKTQMNNWWRCPCCNEVVGQRVIVHKHIHDQRKKNFCEKCGQAIEWSKD